MEDKLKRTTEREKIKQERKSKIKKEKGIIEDENREVKKWRDKWKEGMRWLKRRERYMKKKGQKKGWSKRGMIKEIKNQRKKQKLKK